MNQKYINVALVLVVAVLLYVMIFMDGCNNQAPDDHQAKMDSLQDLYDGANLRAEHYADSINNIYASITLDNDTVAALESSLINIPLKYEPKYIFSDTIGVFELPDYVSEQLSEISL